MRRFLWILFTFFNAGPSWAVDIINCDDVAHWLLGATFGYSTRHHSLEIQLFDRAIDAINPVLNTGLGFSNTGLIGGALAGYQNLVGPWMYGLELSLETNARSKTQAVSVGDSVGVRSWNGDVRYKRSPFTALTGRLGYTLGNLIFFGRLGVGIGEDKIQAHYISLVPSTLDLFNQEKHWVHRFVLGGGVEMPIANTCGITMRLEYNYQSKGQTLVAQGGSIDGLINPFFITGMQPHSQSVKISIVWNYLS